MNKYDFLRKLDKELSPLDKVERKELLAFYEERFYNGTIYENKTEEQVIAELESPEQIAKNILIEYGISPRAVKHREAYINRERKNTSEDEVQNAFREPNTFNVAELIVLICVDLFILSWLIPTLFSVVVSLSGSLLSYIGVVGLIIGPNTVYDQHIFMFATGVYIYLFLFTLVILELFIWVAKRALLYHLKVFKYKKYAEFNKKISKVSVEGWFKRHRLLRFTKNISGLVALVLIVVSGLFLFTHYGEIEELYINQEVITDVTVISDITTEDDYKIYLDLESIEVEVITTQGTDLIITRTHSEDTDDETFSVTQSPDQVNIVHDLPNIIWNFGFSLENLSQLFNRDELVIEVPQGVELDFVEIYTTNGRIDVKDLAVKNMTVHTSNGAITVERVTVENDIELKTINGLIKVVDTEATLGGVLKADTSNGKIVLFEVSFNMMILDTSNGAIQLEDVNLDKRTGTSLSADTSNGEIQLENVYVSIVDLDTSNGDIEYNNDDTSYSVDLTRNTSNGDYLGNIN